MSYGINNSNTTIKRVWHVKKKFNVIKLK